MEINNETTGLKTWNKPVGVQEILGEKKKEKTESQSPRPSWAKPKKQPEKTPTFKTHQFFPLSRIFPDPKQKIKQHKCNGKKKGGKSETAKMGIKQEKKQIRA